MKNRSHIIRLIIIVIIGLTLTFMIYQTKFSTFFFEEVIFGVLMTLALLFWTYTLYKDIKLFKSNKNKKHLLSFVIGVLFIGFILTLNWSIESNFNKPTLLKVFYDGDFNGTGIDFKTDGTYIFDNTAIGISNYQYGTYQIDDVKITIDRKEIDNVIHSDRLEIKQKEINYSDGIKRENYLFQVSHSGKMIENTTVFRVVIDNRNK